MTDDIYAGSSEPVYWVATFSCDDPTMACPVHRLVRTREQAVEAVRLRLLNEFCDPSMFFEGEDEDEDEAKERAEAEELGHQIQAMDFWAMLDFAQKQNIEVSITRLQVGFGKWI